MNCGNLKNILTMSVSLFYALDTPLKFLLWVRLTLTLSLN